MRYKDKPSGFTLIELLVVISIIGVLFAVVITSTAAASRNSRDAKRKADLKSIQQALQHYYVDQNFYPFSNSGGSSLASITEINNCLNITGSAGCPATITVYLSEFPTDPTAGTSTPYCYAAYANPSHTSCDNSSPANYCQYYVLTAEMENPTTGTPESCNGTSYNYPVTPLQ